MQTCTWLFLVMTINVIAHGEAQGAQMIADDEQSAGTSYSQHHINAEVSAYHRLRHSERQRWRHHKLQMHRTVAAEFARAQTQEIFDSLRRQLQSDAHKNAKRTHHTKDLTIKRQRNEALCEIRRNTVHMNTPTEEYDPPFMVEVRCKNVADFERSHGSATLRPQGCVHELLRCVQMFKDVHFSRRKIGSHSWHPYTVANVPSSCVAITREAISSLKKLHKTKHSRQFNIAIREVPT
uniref:Uncharacterized protein n=1 Tax=Parascaris univalens TaxID=6257 RepID=A0A915B7L5_PARUN